MSLQHKIALLMQKHGVLPPNYAKTEPSENSEFRLDLLELLKEQNVVPYTYYRNEKIKHEWQELRNGNVKTAEAINRLSLKFYLSQKTIEGIVYDKEEENP